MLIFLKLLGWIDIFTCQLTHEALEFKYRVRGEVIYLVGSILCREETNLALKRKTVYFIKYNWMGKIYWILSQQTKVRKDLILQKGSRN